ncbi:MAG: hypothetical protein WDN07_03230 [Actinomycetota bacterium]
MDQESTKDRTPLSEQFVSEQLDELRESIALVQVLELNDHCDAYDHIHLKLEEALRAIDGI